MPFRRLLQLLINQTQLIERLSETRPIRRAAEITVAFYNSLRSEGRSAGKSIGSSIKKSLEDGSKKAGASDGFLGTFKSELSKEYDNAKKSGKLWRTMWPICFFPVVLEICIKLVYWHSLPCSLNTNVSIDYRLLFSYPIFCNWFPFFLKVDTATFS